MNRYPDSPSSGPTLEQVTSLYESAMDMIDHLPVGVLWYAPETGKVSYCNGAGVRILQRIEGHLGHDAKAIIGEPLDRLLSGAPDLLRQINYPESLPLRANVTYDDEHLDIACVAVRDHLDRLAGIQVTLIRETEHMRRALTLEQRQRQLEAALAKERELVAMQQQFVSMVSHEFRTPLSIVDAAAQRIARNPQKPERVTDSLTKIRTSIARLTDLIESTLSAAQMESGVIGLNLEIHDIRALLAECCDAQQEVAPEHAIVLRIENVVTPSMVFDHKLMRQVVSNLLSNAVKFSPPRTRVLVHLTQEAGYIYISVRDEGVGIPENEMPRLFSRFFRASTSVGIPGTGIGLNLVRHLVELHGGAVDVESEVGKGTIFVVTLPSREHLKDDNLFQALKARAAAG